MTQTDDHLCEMALPDGTIWKEFWPTSRHAARDFFDAVPSAQLVAVLLHTHDTGAKAQGRGRQRQPTRTTKWRRTQDGRVNPKPWSLGIWGPQDHWPA